jgi:uncharacterized protein (TIGR03437 family)
MINSAANPAQRGMNISVYRTGLGAVTINTFPETTTTPVAVVLGEANAKPSFSGLMPGIVGLYQVNVQVPASLTPGPLVPLSILESGMTSNVVYAGVQ